MLKSREEAKSLREMLSFSKKEEKDPLLDYLLGFKDRMAHAKELLTDEALTAFFFVKESISRRDLASSLLFNIFSTHMP